MEEVKIKDDQALNEQEASIGVLTKQISILESQYNDQLILN